MVTQMGIHTCVNADMFCCDVAFKKSSSRPSISCTQTYEEIKPALKLYIMLKPSHYPKHMWDAVCTASHKAKISVL